MFFYQVSRHIRFAQALSGVFMEASARVFGMKGHFGHLGSHQSLTINGFRRSILG